MNRPQGFTTPSAIKRPIFPGLALILYSGLVAGGSVTDWHVFRADNPTTLSNGKTDSPSIGWSGAPSSTAFLIGYFDPISLTNLGDRITLSFKMSFTDVAGMNNNDDQIRFGLYDINGQPRVKEDSVRGAGLAGFTDNWRGYWFGVDGTQTGSMGYLRKRMEPNIHPIANAGTMQMPGPRGQEVNLRSAPSEGGGPVYSGEMAIERTPTGLAIAGFFGGNESTNSFVVEDPGPFPARYGAVGFLNGAGTSCDRLNLENVTVHYARSNSIQIASDPSSITGRIGESVNFKVGWTGTGLVPSIQWLENGRIISGCTNRVLTVPISGPSQNNNVYSAIVSNVFGSFATSGEAVLTVIR